MTLLFAHCVGSRKCVIYLMTSLVTHKTFHITEQEHEARMDEMRFAVGMTKQRKWKWGRKTEASRYFGLPQDGGEDGSEGQGGGRLPWTMWDQDVVRQLVEHGLEPDTDITSIEDPPAKGGPVRLKCHLEQESASYPNTTTHHEGAEYIVDIVKAQVPVHLVWGQGVICCAYSLLVWHPFCFALPCSINALTFY
jgi:hypothetical protein